MILLRFILPLFIVILLVFILPNLLNFDEQAHYSDEQRILNAKDNYHEENIGDSVKITAGSYYADRSEIHHYFFGKKYRDIWDTEVWVPTFSVGDTVVNYLCSDIGGGDQTINIKLTDNEGKVWTLRSIDKDQSHALHPFFRSTILRFIVRDEVAAMNPYGAFIVDDLAEAAGILHTNPRMVFIPYLESLQEECRLRMAGRLALFEEEPDKEGWNKTETFGYAEKIVETSDMLMLTRLMGYSVDTMEYIHARLFDILIADWDRHEGQWAWALKDSVFHPIPLDRDMAFYKFDDGLINKLMLLVVNKFRSFHPEYKDIPGFVYNSKALDLILLTGVEEEKFIQGTKYLQKKLTDKEIEESFKNYPPPVYQKIGREHIKILKVRKDKLKIAAKKFFAAIQDI